jgi:hypothetical protein
MTEVSVERHPTDDLSASRLHLSSRRLAQDISNAPGTIEIGALADLNFAAVSTSRLMSAGIGPLRAAAVQQPNLGRGDAGGTCSTYCTFITSP